MKKIQKDTILKRARRIRSDARQSRSFLGFSSLFTITLCLVLVFATPGNKALASTFTQNDWSGGTGTANDQYASSENIDTSSGEAVLGNTPISNWCNTANCTTDWTRRQEVHLAVGEVVPNPSVLLHIDYRPEMKSDFSDLRFIVNNGTELPFYLLDKTDSDHARVWLTLEDVTTAGAYTATMYFGNPAASSLSSRSAVPFADNFDNESTADLSATAPSYTFNNGFIALDPETSNNADEIYTTATFDRTVDRVYQFDARWEGYECSNKFSWSTGVLATTNNKFYEINSGGNASDCSSYIDASTYQDTHSTPASVNTFQIGTTYTMRVLARSNGNHDFYYSTDEGKNFSQVASYPATNANTEDFKAYAAAWNGSANGTLYVGNMTVTTTNVNFAAYGLVEHVGGRSGYLTSRVIDTGGPALYGVTNYTISGTGDSVVLYRTADDAGMINASGYYFCSNIPSGTSVLSDNSCLYNSRRYVQYMVMLSADDATEIKLQSISLNYIVDTQAPNAPTNIVMEKNGLSGQFISDGGFTNAYPIVSWDAATDNGESGIAGYCLYVGTDSNPDLSTTSGVISYQSNLNTQGACHYAQTDQDLDVAAIVNGSLQNGNEYFVIIKAIDASGNLGDGAVASFKYDNEPPQLGTVFSLPLATNSKIFTGSWLTISGAQFFDNYSGAAGLKYCVSNALLGFSGCDPNSDQNFYGALHTSGRANDPTDVFPFAAGEITTSIADADRLDDQVAFANMVKIIGVDNAGNVTTGGGAEGIVIITQAATGPPENLDVTPTSNNENSFSFTWDPPTTRFGSVNDIEYCWTVNVTIASNGSNCNWTGKGIYQLAAGAYATQQGLNTLYIATKDITGNFDGSQSTSITFTTNTSAPGVPQDLDISDVSTRATSSWKLAMSWTAPSLPGSGIDSYKIYRSTDNSTFTEVGSTSASNTSFIDSGLDQVLYYYRVKACDNANSCSAPSNTVEMRPTGRFTEPAKLTADTDQPKVKDIGTKNATVYWFTDRESDSKVAYGTSPGQYFSEEVGNSSQVSNHAVTLSNLQPDTTYYFVTKWTDTDGNTGQSGERTLRTAPPPSISEVQPTDISITSASINFRSKDASKVNVYFGRDTNFGGSKSINTASRESTYSIPLSELSDGTKYVFRINGVDSDGNEYPGNTYTFTTLARPRINNLRFQPIEGEPSSTLQVSWNTNVASTSAIAYGPVGGKSTELLSSTLTTEHTLTIRGLEDDTDYTLVATSRDSAGNTATSDTQTFHTALDTRPPKISDVSIETSVRGNGGQARGQIIVSWKTDEPATSQVAFGQGEGGDLTNRTAEDARLSLEHTVVVSDIPTSSIYQIRAVSGDRSGNSSESESITAIIGRGSENVFSIIYSALQKIFGIGN